MKCVICGCSNTKENQVIKAPDPYQLEMNDDETELWECEQCREDSEGDI